MNIDIKGHSGCSIDIIENDDNLFIKKSTTDPKYLNRLGLQAKKQQDDQCFTDSITNPHIHKTERTENEYYILMDYIYANNFIDYFEKASPHEIDNFINNFIQYIHNEIDKCEIKKISKNVFIDKFNSVVKNCEKNELLFISKDNDEL